MILRIFFLDTGLFRILLAKDYILTAPWEVEHAEEELCAFLCAFFRHIVGLELQVIVGGV
jgi:hypothetical protein